VKRVRVLGAVVGAVGLALAGCTSHAGAAAQVDDKTVSTDSVRAIVNRGMDAYSGFAAAHPDEVAQRQPVTRDGLQRTALGNLVEYQLDLIEARKLGVTLSPQEADAYFQAYGIFRYGGVAAFEQVGAASGFAPGDLRTVFRAYALESKIEDTIAPDLVASGAATRSVYDKTLAQLGAKSLPLTYAQAQPFLARQMQNDQRDAKLRPILTATSKDSHVSVNPRFGVWSADDIQVLAADGSIATKPVPTPELNLGM
jgi:hypothetical protein